MQIIQWRPPNWRSICQKAMGSFRPENPRPTGPRAGVGFVEEAESPIPPARDLGERCKFSSGASPRAFVAFCCLGNTYNDL